MKFKVGALVEWKWLGRPIEGRVEKIFTVPTVQVIKGKKIKRNGSKENPAYLVKSLAGNLALKLESELAKRQKRKKTLWEDPNLFKAQLP